MELKDQVAPLEMSKRLKELGVTAESYFHWQHYPEKVYRKESIGIVTPLSKEGITDPGECWPAYTASELGEMLPDMIETDRQFELCCIKESDCWLVRYVAGNDIQNVHPSYQAADTEAKARAAMLIWILENKLVHLS